MRSGGVTGIHPARRGPSLSVREHAALLEGLCDKVGLPHLAEDHRYDTVRKRAAAASEIVPLLHAALAARTALEWNRSSATTCRAPRRAGSRTCSITRRCLAEDMVTTIEHPSSVRTAASRARSPSDARRVGSRSRRRRSGRDSDRFVTDSGFSEDELKALRASGAVR